MENNKKEKISTSSAIIIAGFLIMVGIILTNNKNVQEEPKTLSEQVGVNKSQLTECIKNTDLENVNNKMFESANKAMSHIAENERGTPYSIIVAKNGTKFEIRGANSYENIKKTIEDIKNGNITESTYKGEVVLSETDDHILGNPDAEIMIIEYSDFECPYCKVIHQTLARIVSESNGTVAWMFRHLPYHQNSFEKAISSNCISKLKGNEAFWKYADLLFGLLKTSQDSISDQL